MLADLGSSVERVLLVMDRRADREQLSSWLAARYEVEDLAGADDPLETCLEWCDICLVDSGSLARHRETLLEARDRARPLFLPLLLVRRTGHQRAGDGDPWPVVDDVVDMPVGRAELGGRIDVLLRARRYSLDLERRNARLARFADVVSHDLRNPLNVAQGYLETCREREDSPALQEIETSLTRMQEIIDDVLVLARTGQVGDETTPIDLADAAGNAWETVLVGEATLAIEPDVDVELAGHESLFRELLENLFRNAVEHAGPDVTVRVGALSEGAGFFVEDDGPGIAEDRTEQVFEHGHTTIEDGTGFGLAIVRTIAEAHEWDLTLTEGREGGARFEFRTGSPPLEDESDGDGYDDGDGDGYDDDGDCDSDDRSTHQ